MKFLILFFVILSTITFLGWVKETQTKLSHPEIVHITCDKTTWKIMKKTAEEIKPKLKDMNCEVHL